MARPNSINNILDAAESIVLDEGGAHLTLDAVAERCGLSKGGLIYHFPTKEALLQGMIERFEVKLEAMRKEIRSHNGNGENSNELAIDITMMRDLSPDDYRLSAALLAVIANQPELMHPFRDQHYKRFWETLVPVNSFKRSSVLLFAAMGLHFHELLHISIVSGDQRREIFDELLRLADSKKEI